ncbi:MAG: biotin transporter BioY [Bacilli bacterium]|nr:biotin transporter BioY [Bacilli bacterium]
MNIRRITTAGIFLAVLCALGCLSIPFGENVKVSLQLLVVFIIFALTDHLLDKIIITGAYLVLGLFLPIYAGFNAGITPTFGFVISFVVAAIPFHFLYKIKFKNEAITFGLTCLVTTLLVYVIGSLFLYFYLKSAGSTMTFGKSLMISVVPYIPFDIAKIVIGFFAVKLLKPVVNKNKTEEAK